MLSSGITVLSIACLCRSDEVEVVRSECGVLQAEVDMLGVRKYSCCEDPEGESPGEVQAGSRIPSNCAASCSGSIPC